MSATIFTPYVPLWVKSNGSFLEGASQPEELVEEAHHLGLRSIAVTDRAGVYGVVRAHQKAKELGVHLLLGAEVTVEAQRLVMLAQDRAGWASLCELLSVGRRRTEKGSCLLHIDDVCKHHAGLLALFTGESVDGEVPLEQRVAPDSLLARLRDVYDDRLYALVTRHRRAEEVAAEARMRALASRHGILVAAGSEVLYHTPARRPLQDLMTCIRHQVKLVEAGRLIRPNDEHALKSPHAFDALFADDPAAVERTRQIAARCTFSLDQLRYRYPSERLPDGLTSSQHLRQLAYTGALGRYRVDCEAALSPEVSAQLDKELALVDELDYCGYFLTMYEVVEFCRLENILCQGRGSAANSVLCYCLGITALDPIAMGFLFERFISRERAEPPDIDLDIEHERREEVIQHVYRKYGRDRAAMVANVIRYRPRSALRDVGRALGLDETTLDRLAKLLTHYDGATIDIARQAGLDPEAPITKQLLEWSDALLGFPRHLSIHPGGFLLGHDPVFTMVPIENATMENRTVIQWDKDDVEALGLFKVDLLALGTLTHLHKSFDMLAAQGIHLSLPTIPPDDGPTYDLICAGDTIGVFQIESRAQMNMLPRLRPRVYYDLVIEVSIVRPGPITGGMVHPFLRRKNGEEAVTYPHPLLEPVLKKTLGVPLFQEQVMRVAMIAADYTPGEADQLRRDMAAWRRGGKIEQHRERLVSRMTEKGIAPEFAENVYKQICGFGEYGFPESHAASFALLSYAGAYLRTHHRVVFTCGLLNSQPMGFYTPSTIVEDARRHGVRVLPIDVNASDWDCTIEDGALRMGTRYVKSLSQVNGHAIRRDRPYTSVEDVAHRAQLNTGAMNALAEAGAFESLRVNRRTALWQTRALNRSTPVPLPVEETSLPQLAKLSRFDAITWDYRRTRHSTRGHPLGPIRPQLTAQGLPDAATLAKMRNGQRLRYAGLVICRQRPATASGVTFMSLEDETGIVNVVIWRQVFERFAATAKSESFLGISGRLQIESGVVNLVAESLWRPDIGIPVEGGASRDFH